MKWDCTIKSELHAVGGTMFGADRVQRFWQDKERQTLCLHVVHKHSKRQRGSQISIKIDFLKIVLYNGCIHLIVYLDTIWLKCCFFFIVLISTYILN